MIRLRWLPRPLPAQTPQIHPRMRRMLGRVCAGGLDDPGFSPAEAPRASLPRKLRGSPTATSFRLTNVTEGRSSHVVR